MTTNCALLTYLIRVPFRMSEEGEDCHLPPRYWGQPCNLQTLKMNWHTPSGEEMAQAGRILRKFLSVNLQALHKFSNGEDEEMTKEKLKRHLMVVDVLLVGAASVLPFWTYSNSTAKNVDLYDTSAVPIKVSTKHSECLRINLEDGANVRLRVIDLMIKVQEYILRKREDDIQSLIQLADIYDTCVFYGGITQGELESVLYSMPSEVKKQLGTSSGTEFMMNSNFVTHTNLQPSCLIHYYMVLPLLLPLGGKHFIQGKLENHGILGVLYFRMPLFKQGAF